MHDRQARHVISDDPDNTLTSKTRRKAQMHALQEIGKRLTTLDGDRLAQITLPETLRIAIVEAGRIHKHGAFRRQLQYIGKLMRAVDTAPIEAKLAEWSSQSHEATAHHHHLEQLRHRLLTDDQAMNDLAHRFPRADIQHLRTLTRNARREQTAGKPLKSSRMLFRELRALLETEITGESSESTNYGITTNTLPPAR